MAATARPNKLAFLSQPAPASYVAGLGRGASGFTTRSDIGPAREGPSAEAIAEAQAKRGEEPDVDLEQFQDPDNEVGLFAGTTYEQDDEEADQIYDLVDQNMDARRRARRETREQEEMAKMRAERPKIQQQFADLKRGLGDVTDEQWESLPEVGNLTRKKRKRDFSERTFAVPDSILVGDRDKGQYENSLDPMQQEYGGVQTPADSGTLTNFVEMGQARDKILSLKLDQASGISTSIGSGTSTSIDPKGYLTDLNSVIHKSEAEIGDIKRARMLFDSLIKSNPKHAPGWIAAASLEEHAGRMVAARKVIKEGCQQCPKNEDVWLEAARLHNNHDAKVILASAVQHVGQSVKIWMTAANLEGDPKSKKRVLRKALESIPNSVRLWKEVVNLETSRTDALVLLARAVEVIPTSVELWLALSRLETPDRAKAVLNKARKACPASHEIWIAAGRLLEQNATESDSPEGRRKMNDQVDKTIDGGVRELRRHGVLLSREQWLTEAEKCENESFPRTAEAIVKATIGMDVEAEDQLDTWSGDAEASEGRGRIHVARSILAHALRVFPDQKALWWKAAELEKTHGTGESLGEVLSRAVQHCPQAEDLWLMRAKELWNSGDVPASRDVLKQAFDANPESEKIWLAAVKLEAENGEIAVARELLNRARSVADTARIWMKSIVFERQHGNIDEALSILTTAIQRYPKSAKLYMIQGQIHQAAGRILQARTAFAAGVKANPKDVTLWILSSRLEEADNKSIKARALLEKARLVNPAEDKLWAEAFHVEERSTGAAQAKTVLARGLQDCPTSGLLWSLSIWAEPRPARKSRSADAIRKCDNNPLVACTVARLFWAERKVDKARQWFGRALATDAGKDIGDIWGWWMKFEGEYSEPEEHKTIINKCVAAEPRHGEVWQSVAKDVRNNGKTTKQILQLVCEALR